MFYCRTSQQDLYDQKKYQNSLVFKFKYVIKNIFSQLANLALICSAKRISIKTRTHKKNENKKKKTYKQKRYMENKTKEKMHTSNRF